jgi:hypothetical protein
MLAFVRRICREHDAPLFLAARPDLRVECRVRPAKLSRLGRARAAGFARPAPPGGPSLLEIRTNWQVLGLPADKLRVRDLRNLGGHSESIEGYQLNLSQRKSSPQPRDDKMSGNWASAPSERSDSQGTRVTNRVANGNYRVDRCCLHDDHLHNLRCSRRPTGHSVIQVHARGADVHEQLRGLVDADLEKDLIKPDICQ